VIVEIASAAALGAGAMTYGCVARSSSLFGRSVYRGPGARKSIALTFDDGPSEGTLPLLETLSKHHVPATFFECGLNVRRLPAVALEVVAQGHELGNHSDNHPCMVLRTTAFIEREFGQAQRTIAGETGVVPKLMRAPYGLRWPGMGAMQKRLDLLGVMWTVIGHDWEWDGDRVAKFVLERATPGGIICLHDGRDIQARPDTSQMLAAVREIVPRLLDQGYTFETVSKLLLPNGRATS